MRRTTVDDLLAAARERLHRVAAGDLPGELAAGARLVDIRSDSQRAGDGEVPGAAVIARNVLEWRCDPDCEARDDRLADVGARLVVMCDEGYQSSFAAATLMDLGFARATDLDGGFQAYRAAGLPVERA